MNDKYIAERLGILESKVDILLSNVALLLKQIGYTSSDVNDLLDVCPVCGRPINFIFASDGAVIRKCGCSTGKTSVDVNYFSQPSTK